MSVGTAGPPSTEGAAHDARNAWRACAGRMPREERQVVTGTSLPPRRDGEVNS